MLLAMWDMSEAKATNGDLSTYANAKVGEIITFGNYYQTGNRINNDENAEYEKTPIEWIVVDKDERTGQLTLMSKYILAAGSFFGNYFCNNAAIPAWGTHYDGNATVASIPYNQAYIDSTARAFLNNLERLDMGGDSFDAINGYVPSGKNSTKETGLLSSVGFSNQRYWTGYNTETAKDLEGKSGIYKRPEVLTMNNADKTEYYELYYQRPIGVAEYKNRPATRGFLAEAFDNSEKSMIVPKVIAGYIGHRWPDNDNDSSTKSCVEGAVDKVWLPSVTELNVTNGQDWNNQQNDAWTNPSDEAGSTVFEYFKNYNQYKNPYTNRDNTSVADAVKATRTNFAKNSFAMNYSIPVYKKGTTEVNTDINATLNSSDHYWTRSPSSSWYNRSRIVGSSGSFGFTTHLSSNFGVRPCIIIKY